MINLSEHFQVKENRMSHIKNLITLAAVDGHIDKDEMDMIALCGAQMGLTRDEIERVVQNPASISFTPPTTTSEKVAQLTDMVYVMMIDMEINDNELAFCKIVAEAMGFKTVIIDAILLSILNSVKEGLDAEEAKARAERVVA